MKYRFRVRHPKLFALTLLMLALAVSITAMILWHSKDSAITHEDFKRIPTRWTPAEAERLFGTAASIKPYSDEVGRTGSALIWHTQEKWPQDRVIIRRKIVIAFDNDGRVLEMRSEPEPTIWQIAKWEIAKWATR
jgi:hypothetical protein